MFDTTFEELSEARQRHTRAVCSLTPVEPGDEFRASGECICAVCGETYYRHPALADFLFLHLICTGDVVKL